jgi:hypothetical protein
MSNPESSKMDFFEVGDKTSLICAPTAIADVVKATLRELGYKFHTADTPELAIERIRYTSYNCIIIDETFAGSSLKSNPVLGYLAPLPMAQRRNSVVCVIGSSFKTLDAMQAFAQSVSLVINPSDMPNLTAILKRGLAESETLYRSYQDTLATMGGK